MKWFVFITIMAFGQVMWAQNETDVSLNRKSLSLSDLAGHNTANKIEVFSASKTAHQIKDLPFTIHVISKEEILQNNYFTLADVMKDIPGVKTSQPGSAEVGEMFLLRGLKGNYYTKVLINNIPIAPSVSGNTIIGFNLPIRQAEAIEIILGPAAAIYGADAASGVINIITRKSDSRFYGSGDVTIGSNGFRSFDFSTGGRIGMDENVINYSIYGTSGTIADLDVYTEKNEVYNPLKFDGVRNIGLERFGLPFPKMKVGDLTEEFLMNNNVNPDDFALLVFPSNYTGDLRSVEHGAAPMSGQQLGVNFRYGNLVLDYHYYSTAFFSNLGLTPFAGKYNNPTNQLRYNSNRFAVSYTGNVGGFSLSTNLSYLHYRADNQSNFGVTYLFKRTEVYKYTASDDILFEQTVSYRPIKKLEVLGGFTYALLGGLPQTNELWDPFETSHYTSFSTNELPPDAFFQNFGLNPVLRKNYAGFVQAAYFSKNYTIVGSLRRDVNSAFGPSTNGRIAVLARLRSDLSLKASVGQAYKAPSPDIEYKSAAFPESPEYNEIVYAYVPNSDLKPEQMISYELSLNYTPTDNFSLLLNTFVSAHKNPIIEGEIELDRSLYPKGAINTRTHTRTNFNVDSLNAQVYGIQIQSIWKNIVPSIKLSTNFSLLHQGGYEVMTDDKTKKHPYRQISPWVGKLTVKMTPFKRVFVKLDNAYFSSWYRQHIVSMWDYKDAFNRIEGFYNLDALISLKINKMAVAFLQVRNVLNTSYGGIDATGTDIDLQFNPQMARSFRIGLNVNLN